MVFANLKRKEGQQVFSGKLHRPPPHTHRSNLNLNLSASPDFLLCIVDFYQITIDRREGIASERLFVFFL